LGTAIFAQYLEDKVALPRNPVDGAHAIIRKTWEEYQANSSNGMVKALDQVLKRPDYGTTLADEFPKFTWNNYFMITGTYSAVLPGRVYTNLADPMGRDVFGRDNWHDNWNEWQLFRFWLNDERRDYQNDNAGVLVDRVGQSESYPIDGPLPGKPSVVDSLGAAYVEFFPTSLPQGRVADLTVVVSLKVYTGGANPKVSIIPITNFGSTSPNNFVVPVIVPEGTYLVYKYTQTVQNFHQLNRVAVIISG